MKEFFKKYSFIFAIAATVIFLAIFLSFLFKKVGDDVYIIGVTGDVSIGSTADLHNTKPAAIGMKLSKDNIVVTNDKSSCILSYNKKADDRDNFINIGENSQIMIYDKNAQGGYKFFVTYGSVICNMPVERSYRTNISSKLFNLYVDGTITKTTYDNETNTGKVFTFDGNPQIQLIQPSGTTNAADKLLKNSVCAVSDAGDGTIAFGCLNVGFGLNELTAQDLKTMSGVASMWSEKISYGADEFERAFQTASDYAKWAVTDPAIITTLSAAQTEPPVISSDTYAADASSATSVPEEYVESTSSSYVVPTGATQTVPILSGNEDEDEVNGSTSVSDSDGVYVPYTAFTRQTMVDLESGEEPSVVTTVLEDKQETDISASRTNRPRETEPYSKHTETAVTTTPDKPATTTVTGGDSGHSTERPVTQAPAVTSGYNTGTKPSIQTAPPSSVSMPKAYYTVIFSYKANGVEYWSVQIVKHGQAAIAPEEPVVPGKIFTGWNRDFSDITSDMEISAVFGGSGNQAATPVKDTYTVNFYVESKLWKTVTVKRGESVIIKEKPVASDKNLVFCGWSDDLTNIRSDKTVFALFRTK